MKIKFLLFILIFAQSALYSLNESEVESIFTEGNEAYKNQDWDIALEKYLSIVKDFDSPQLFGNIGNTYFQKGELSEAIYNYSKSLKMDPGQDDVTFNLSIAKLKTVDKIENNYEDGLKTWWKRNLAMIGIDRLAIISIILSVLTLVLFVLFLWSHTRIIKVLGFYFGIGFLVLSILSFWSSQVAKSDVLNMNRGIVMKEKLDVKSAPTETSSDVFVLHEGTDVMIKSTDNGWYEISLGDDRVGWVKMSAVRGF